MYTKLTKETYFLAHFFRHFQDMGYNIMLFIHDGNFFFFFSILEQNIFYTLLLLFDLTRHICWKWLMFQLGFFLKKIEKRRKKGSVQGQLCRMYYNWIKIRPKIKVWKKTLLCEKKNSLHHHDSWQNDMLLWKGYHVPTKCLQKNDWEKDNNSIR